MEKHQIKKTAKLSKEEQDFKTATERLLFKSPTVRSALVFISLVPILPIGLIALFFWIRGRKRLGRGDKTAANNDFAEAENMALTSISFGLLGVLTVLMCIDQLKRNLKTVYG